MLVELDPDNPGATLVGGVLENQGTVSALDPASMIVTDLSDDTADPADDDPNGDNNPDDPTALTFASIGLEKQVTSSGVSGSGVEGNFDVTYTFTVTNTGLTDLDNLALFDDWATQLGGNFVRILPGSVVVSNVDATTLPGANASYAGGAAESMLDGGGLIETGQSFTVEVTVEVDPDADPFALVNGQLENLAVASGEDPATAGGPVSDTSDDPTVATDVDPDGDNDPDDPTVFGIRSISLDKTSGATAPAASGIAGNVDVTWTFTVTNTGSTDLVMLALSDDWAGQIGGAFVRTIPGSVSVSNISATTAPGSNAAYLGGATENMLDGTGLLATGEQFEVSVTVELDPDNPTAIYQPGGVLENQATIQAEDLAANPVSDLSDDPSDLTDSDPDSDNDPDDPTAITVPSIELEKTVGSVSPATSGVDGQFDITYQFVVTNTGSTPLSNLSLTDDWASLLGANFVRTLPASVSVTNIDADVAPGANAAYSGAATENMLDGSGSFDAGQSFTVSLTVEVDPDADPSLLSNGQLLNQAVVAGQDASGITVSDLSDDPTDATDVDPDSDNDPDDPTAVGIPRVSLTKAIVGAPVPATSGAIDNIDATYSLVATNTGSETLTNLSLIDDLATQFGGAFIRVVPGTVSVTNVDATSAPTANPGFDGTAGSDLLVGSPVDQVESGQSFSVSMVVELDPDHPAANLVGGVLVNQATVSGDAPSGTVSDLSDNPSDATNNDLNGDNDPDDPTVVSSSAIEATKASVSAFAASSGVNGNYDVTYLFTLTNTGTAPLNNLTLIDDWVSQLGGNFVAVLPGTVSVTNIDAAVAPTAVATYSGGSTESMITGGSLNSRQSFEVTVTVELDPDADPSAFVGGQLKNQATVTGDDPTSTTVADTTDDPLNPLTTVDDPTLLAIPEVQLTHQVLNVAPVSGGNALIDYQLVVTNVGNDTLTNFMLTDDWATQFGGAFVGVTPGSVLVTNVDATSVPGANPTYAGGPVENMLDGSGILASGESFVVTIQVEVDPTDPTAILVGGELVNSATVTASGTSASASDVSDDPADPTQLELEGDNEPDDPTRVSFSRIGVAKQALGVVPNGENFDVEFELVVENTGSRDLNSISLVEDLTANLGAAFVEVASAPTIVGSTSTMSPTLNPAWDGVAATNVFDGASGLLAPAETVTVRFAVTVDPDVTGESTPLNNQAQATAIDSDGMPVDDVSDDGTDPGTTNSGFSGDTGTTDDPTPVEIGDIGLAKGIVNIEKDLGAQQATLTVNLVIENTGTVYLDNLVLNEDVALQYGTNFVAVAGPPTIISTSAGAIAPNLNPAWETDTSQNMFDGTSGLLQPGGQIVVQFAVVLQPDGTGLDVTNQADVSGRDPNGLTHSDLSDNGLDPNTANGSGGTDDPTPTEVRFFAFDSNNNFAIGFPGGGTTTVHLPRRPLLDTLYTGITQPGATLRLQIFNQGGLQIGERTVVADSAGNWLAHFPNATVHTSDQHYGSTHFGSTFRGTESNRLVRLSTPGNRTFDSQTHSISAPFGVRSLTSATAGHRLYHMPGTEIDFQPHRMEVQQMPAIQSSSLGDASGWNIHRFFHPAVHTHLYFFQGLTVRDAFMAQPRNVLTALHSLNENPLQLTTLRANEATQRVGGVSW